MTPALLFDMDGTLVDTEHLHFSAFQTVLAPHGVTLSWADYRQFIMGHPNHAIAAHFLPHLPPDRHGAVIDDKEARYRALVTDVTPAAGLTDLLDWADREGVPCAVVTNAPRANAELVLRALGLRDRFKAVVPGDEVESPKPHPMPYLTAAAALDGDLSRTVAFEDSGSGVASALAAGLPVVGIAPPADENGLMGRGAALLIADYRDPALMGFLRRRLGLGAGRRRAHPRGSAFDDAASFCGRRVLPKYRRNLGMEGSDQTDAIVPGSRPARRRA